MYFIENFNTFVLEQRLDTFEEVKPTFIEFLEQCECFDSRVSLLEKKCTECSLYNMCDNVKIEKKITLLEKNVKVIREAVVPRDILLEAQTENVSLFHESESDIKKLHKRIDASLEKYNITE